MAKSAINKVFKLNAQGILAIMGDNVSIENPDTGNSFPLAFSSLSLRTSL